MKQYITREQFDELSQESKRKLFIKLFPNIPEHPMQLHKGVTYGPVDINNKYLNIGIMIVFFG